MFKNLSLTILSTFILICMIVAFLIGFGLYSFSQIEFGFDDDKDVEMSREVLREEVSKNVDAVYDNLKEKSLAERIFQLQIKESEVPIVKATVNLPFNKVMKKRKAISKKDFDEVISKTNANPHQASISEIASSYEYLEEDKKNIIRSIFFLKLEDRSSSIEYELAVYKDNFLKVIEDDLTTIISTSQDERLIEESKKNLNKLQKIIEKIESQSQGEIAL